MTVVRSSIDIGTHSVRFLAADISATPPLALETGIDITRLGEGLDRSNSLMPSAIERTANVVKRFSDAAGKFNSVPFVFGTAALREALNGARAAEKISEVSGLNVNIISDKDEARFTYMGATIDGSVSAGDMVIDIGGGSTEFITSDGSNIVSNSVKLGSVRHFERHISSDPPHRLELEKMRDDIRREVLIGIGGRRPKRLHGVAGSVTQLAALELEMKVYDSKKINGYILKKDTIEKWISRLSELTIEDRKKITGMVAGRESTVIAGTAILYEIVCALSFSEVIVHDYDSLWGALSVPV